MQRCGLIRTQTVWAEYPLLLSVRALWVGCDGLKTGRAVSLSPDTDRDETFSCLETVQHDVSMSQPDFWCCCLRHHFNFLHITPFHYRAGVTHIHSIIVHDLYFGIFFKSCHCFFFLYISSVKTLLFCIPVFHKMFFFGPTPAWVILVEFVSVSDLDIKTILNQITAGAKNRMNISAFM